MPTKSRILESPELLNLGSDWLEGHVAQKLTSWMYRDGFLWYQVAIRTYLEFLQVHPDSAYVGPMPLSSWDALGSPLGLRALGSASDDPPGQ